VNSTCVVVDTSVFFSFLLGRGLYLKDAPFVALTLQLDGRLWTSDEELKVGLKVRGFDRFFEPQQPS